MDVFVLTSVSESGPLSLLEALSMEIPCVSTDVGIAKKVIKTNESGILVNKKDSESIFKGVCRMHGLLGKQLVNFKRKGRSNVEKLF